MSSKLEMALKAAQAQEHLASFQMADVTDDRLHTVTDSVLQGLGVGDAGTRGRILAEFARIATHSASPNGSDALAGGATMHAGFAAPAPRQGTAGASDLLAASATMHAGSGAAALAATANTNPGSAPPLEVKQKLNDRYLLRAKLGEGAMGAVFKALDEKTDQDVAIKVILPEFVGSSDAVRLFVDEAKKAMRLAHPHLVKVNTIEGGAYDFIVMELIDGGTLTDIWKDRRRKIPPDELKRILLQVLDGLGYLHEQGMVHRDIKPDNIMMTSQGKAKIADYGVAATMREQRRAANAAGTPNYMAPEQFGGDPDLDGRADLYSVGMMGYELLLGKLPFEGKTLAEISTWHQSPNRDLSALKSIPYGDVLAKALAVNPDDRWEDATAMRAALKAAGDMTSARAAPSPAPGPPLAATMPAATPVAPPQTQQSSIGAVAVVAGLLLAAGGGAFVMMGGKSETKAGTVTAGTSASDKYWISAGSKNIGPYDVVALRAYVDDGRIKRDTQLLKDGTTTWIPAGRMPDLFAPLPDAAAAAAPAVTSLDLRGACSKQPVVSVVANPELIATTGEQIRSALANAGCSPGVVSALPSPRSATVVFARDPADPAAKAFADVLGAPIERNTISSSPVLIAIGGPPRAAAAQAKGAGAPSAAGLAATAAPGSVLGPAAGAAGAASPAQGTRQPPVVPALASPRPPANSSSTTAKAPPSLPATKKEEPAKGTKLPGGPALRLPAKRN